jgi:hypothetical protein
MTALSHDMPSDLDDGRSSENRAPERAFPHWHGPISAEPAETASQ